MGEDPRVLIVDDEQRFRSTMARLLSARGVEAKTAGSGMEALEIMKQESFDVAIVDVKMPEMNGIDLLREMKKIDRAVEVIIMTAYASVDTAKAILERGAYDYMLKPYAVDELVEKIGAAYDRKQARLRLTGDGKRDDHGERL
ncbi:MAG: response regulator [Desulfomonilaceae bacterium]|nr:response regulator [Desulfomonilaceae bacterium]